MRDKKTMSNTGFEKEILLGICIPTYNRKDALKANIDNLEDRLSWLDFTIYISDNASDDGTQQTIADLQAKYGNIVYSRNDQNLGSNKNIRLALGMSRSRFSWLIGDDDTLCDDVHDIIDILKTEAPDVLVMGQNDKIAEGWQTDKDYVFHEVMYEMTWMSGLIFSTEILPKLDFGRYVDTFFVHTGAIVDLFLTEGLKLYYKSGVWMRQMRKHTGYERSGLEVYGRGWTDLVMRLPHYSYEEKLAYLRDRTKRYGMLNNKILLSQRGYGEYDPAMLKKYYPYIRLYNSSPYFVLFLVSIFPTGLISGLRKLYRKLFMKGQPERVDNY